MICPRWTENARCSSVPSCRASLVWIQRSPPGALSPTLRAPGNALVTLLWKSHGQSPCSLISFLLTLGGHPQETGLSITHRTAVPGKEMQGPLPSSQDASL